MTKSRILAISPVFSYGLDDDRFCVIERGRLRLEEVHLTNGETAGFVAIYVIEQPEPEYNDDPSTFGRVVVLVRPLPIKGGLRESKERCFHDALLCSDEMR